MTYGYIRVSSDDQDTENQKLGIIEKAGHLGIVIEEWISDDGVSGAKEPEKRLLGKLLKKVKENDVIVVSEISRLGRSLFMVFRILEDLLNRGVKLYSVKDGYTLDNTITSKVLAFAFGMASEIERDMIRKRTKEALARKRAEGIVLGRPVGSFIKTSNKKLLEKKPIIEKLLQSGMSISKVSQRIKCCRCTLSKFIARENIVFDKRNYNNSKAVEAAKERAEKHWKPLFEAKDQIVAWIEQGIVSSRELAKKLNEEGFEISEYGVRTFLIRADLYDFWLKASSKLRLERNAKAKDHNPEKIKQYAGL